MLLTRSLTSDKITYANEFLSNNYQNIANKKAIIEIHYLRPRSFLIFWIDIDSNGNRTLKQQVFEGDLEEIKQTFEINLTM